MSDIAIKVENLSKRYRLLSQGRGNNSLKDLLLSPLRNLREIVSLTKRNVIEAEQDDYFWALKDNSFEIKKGEVVAIVGRNGAGKTTLLKILSKITAPTSGRIEINGRVNSLLAVGTGFNGELTGRENVYMNGTIHGMSRKEINRKFDEIVDFAGVEKFIDMPVKRYSSGMGVRLGFAVAAFLEPEILIIDEVLAVGDIAFQNKCMGKMREIGQEGRTVLLVSHNMQTVKRLSQQGILLRSGKIEMIDSIESIVSSYMQGIEKIQQGSDITQEMHLRYPPKLEIHRFEITNSSGKETRELLMDESFSMSFYYKVNDEAQRYRVSFVIKNDDGSTIAASRTNQEIEHLSGEKGKQYCLNVKAKNLFLYGEYKIEINVKTYTGEAVDHIEGISFTVLDVSVLKDRNYINPGVVYFPTEWSYRQIS